jgi:hypothetical protein
MGCSQGTASSSRQPPSSFNTLLEDRAGQQGVQEDAKACKTLGQSRRSLLTMVDGMPGVKAVDGFIPLLQPGILIGSGSDPRSVVLHSATLGGSWIADGSQDVVVTASTCSSSKHVQAPSGGPDACSKRWLVAAHNDGFLKVVELEVTSSNDQLYVHAVSAWQRPQNSDGTVDVGTEANMALNSKRSMSAAPVATSSAALGYGVQFLAFSNLQAPKHDGDDSAASGSTLTGGQETDASREGTPSGDEQVLTCARFTLDEAVGKIANINTWDAAAGDVVLVMNTDDAAGRQQWFACC